MTAFAGPGKYDDLATLVRKRSNASAVLVIVIGGNKGEGFSFQGDWMALQAVPDLLDVVARSIRDSEDRDAKPQ
jgi:hypothetical protein